MFFIHQFTCISPQQTFPVIKLETLHEPKSNKLLAIEPNYSDIPRGLLRRMSKPVRLGIGAALPLMEKTNKPNGIIIGTANAGMEDCFYFLQQIAEYNEGLLTPGNFVQSTPNALAAQLSMLSNNKGYNITHVHLGLAFENAIIDALMLLNEQPDNTYLLGAVDDISTYNCNINLLDGWYKEHMQVDSNLYETGTKGSIPGEGAAMFLVNNNPRFAAACLKGIDTLHSTDKLTVKKRLQHFLEINLPTHEKVDVLISGENGDSRLSHHYAACEELVGPAVGIIRYKHMSGEYPTASAMALWLGCYLLTDSAVPLHMIKKNFERSAKMNILIYNTFKGAQHSFILVSGV